MSDALQIGGAILTTIGIGLIFIPAGLIAAGLFAILIGISLERR